MKNISLVSFLSLSVFLLLGCSQMKRKQKTETSTDSVSVMNSIQAEQVADQPRMKKKKEYTHELAEANADDIQIKKEVGASEIDSELPGSESDAVPYSRDFLKKKNTKRMHFWIDYFTKKNRDRFQRFINNGEEYRHHIEEIFQQYGLPKELYFVGLIESGYYLGARSHASAVGPWQFIKATGRRYGMRITNELDERQDLFKATHAAAQYFKDLHNIFSSWELALAAYNSGENGMIRRIMKYGTRDFYTLSRKKHLPSETINYVPKVLAAMHIVNNAQEYGFILPKKKVRLFDSTVLKPMQRNVSLKTIAQRLNIDEKLLKKLNPELRRGRTPSHFVGTYMLRVPALEYAYKFEEKAPEAIVAQTKIPKFSRPESRRELARRIAGQKIHRVRTGETLISLARKYKTTPKALAEYNNFKSWRTKLKVGQKINIIGNEEQLVSTRMASTPKVKITNHPIVYKVSRGDNLTEIAKLFNSPVNRIKQANKLKHGKIMVGQRLVLPGTRKAVYTVRAGDHLTKVAQDFKLPINTLIKINSLKRKTIYPGQKIIVNMD